DLPLHLLERVGDLVQRRLALLAQQRRAGGEEDLVLHLHRHLALELRELDLAVGDLLLQALGEVLVLGGLLLQLRLRLRQLLGGLGELVVLALQVARLLLLLGDVRLELVVLLLEPLVVRLQLLDLGFRRGGPLLRGLRLRAVRLGLMLRGDQLLPRHQAPAHQRPDGDCDDLAHHTLSLARTRMVAIATDLQHRAVGGPAPRLARVSLFDTAISAVVPSAACPRPPSSWKPCAPRAGRRRAAWSVPIRWTRPRTSSRPRSAAPASTRSPSRTW